MTAQLAIDLAVPKALAMRCPVCKVSLSPLDLTETSARRECARCHFVVASQGGIWRALDPVREIHFRRFASEYLAVLEREGRGAQAAEHGCPASDDGWQQRIRACSLAYLESKLLPAMEARHQRPLRVLDLGAGNGWLSCQLAWRGHHCVAIDLLDHPVHGLGAVRSYRSRAPRPISCVQAEMDNLPFAAGQFDVAIFNASLHYSEDFVRTLRESLRCLQPGGEVIILETPFYRSDESGRAMVLERREALTQQYGSRPDRIRSREYLTSDVLEALEHECGLRWCVGRPWFGLNWAVRPWKAMLQGGREPAKFYVFSATVASQAASSLCSLRDSRGSLAASNTLRL